MPPKKNTEDKIVIKRFKDRSSHFWVDNHHYFLNEDNEIQYSCGGIDKEEYREALSAYCKRNKVTFVPREKSLFETEKKEYSIVNFGKYKGESTYSIFSQNNKYAKWIFENTADEKIKLELKELLKRK